MVANSPSLIAVLSGCVVGLAVHTGLHDVVLADGTVVYMDVPGPKAHSVPFLHFESSRGDGFDHYFLVGLFML